jgi:hypothetical protein
VIGAPACSAPRAAPSGPWRAYDRSHSQQRGKLLAVNAFYLQIIIGALSLIAVAFDQRQSRAT